MGKLAGLLLLLVAISSAQARQSAPKSGAEAAEVLTRARGDKYAPKVDWSAVPPWRQTDFFGVKAQGQTFIYVVDCSGSMDEGDRLVRAKREIRRSVGKLRWPQKFHVIFYNDGPIPLPGGLPRSADAKGKAGLDDWLSLIDAEGPTDPREAMSQALALNPDAVFLLTDGEYPEGSAEAIAAKNPKGVPIHCVDMAGRGTKSLRKIAADSGGEYVARPR